MRALITGATGFVGSRFVAAIDEPVVLSRSPERARDRLGDKVRSLHWDPSAGPPPAEAFEGVELVVHLAGEPIAEGRWNAEKKRRIRDSRVIGTRHLVEGMKGLSQPPRLLYSASAVGYYGSRGEEKLDESAPPGSDFLAEVCAAWEREAQAATALGVRVVNPRIGLVLGEGGGALEKMLPLFKFGLGGRLGKGLQWMSWVHVDDLVGLAMFALQDESLSGPVNAVSPEPVRNRDFTQTLGLILRRPTVLPAPAVCLRMGLGEFADVLLASQRVIPKVALEHGYEFRFPTLEAALRDAIEGRTPAKAAAGA